jgi:hypothetical protein
MEKKVYRNLSLKCGAFLSVFCIIIVFYLIFSSFGFLEGKHNMPTEAGIQIIFFILFILFFINAYYTGIIVDNIGITSFSLLKKSHFIGWDDIADIGVFRNTENGYKRILLANAHKKLAININTVYLSSAQTQHLTDAFFKQKNVVVFYYRKELFDFVMEKTKFNAAYPN